MSKPRASTSQTSVRHNRGDVPPSSTARFAAFLALSLSFALSLIPFLAWLGLGVHRRATPAALTLASMLVVYTPALLASIPDGKKTRWNSRIWRLSLTLAAWSTISFLAMPVWFPGERADAVATGIGALGFPSERLPKMLAAKLPNEPTVAIPQLAEADALVQQTPPPAQPIGDNQIALPYEGEGRRMSVPVIFGSSGIRELEVDMLLDTGATYTTLTHAALAKLGVKVSKRDPVIRLHTANGERDATLVLIDHVWLGDLKIDGVAVAVCDDCGTADTAGLLGLNVVGGFNVTIDADRKEVLFSRRTSFDRKLDIKPFIDLDATFTRFPGGRVEVVVNITNNGARAVHHAQTQIRCRDDHWTVTTETIASGEPVSAHRKLPDHAPCDEYEISLLSADW